MTRLPRVKVTRRFVRQAFTAGIQGRVAGTFGTFQPAVTRPALVQAFHFDPLPPWGGVPYVRFHIYRGLSVCQRVRVLVFPAEAVR